MKLEVRAVLKNKELRKEYEELHTLIEGHKPSCTGCSAKGKLAAWKSKYSDGIPIEIKQTKNKNMNTFKLNKKQPRVSVPFSGAVITKDSKDELVWHYLSQAKEGTKERKRRESFFEALPKSLKKEKEVVIVDVKDIDVNVTGSLEEAREAYKQKFEKDVSNRYKNDLTWIHNHLEEE
jgi:hypothetical protein